MPLVVIYVIIFILYLLWEIHVYTSFSHHPLIFSLLVCSFHIPNQLANLALPLAPCRSVLGSFLLPQTLCRLLRLLASCPQQGLLALCFRTALQWEAPSIFNCASLLYRLMHNSGLCFVSLLNMGNSPWGHGYGLRGSGDSMGASLFGFWVSGACCLLFVP